MNGVERRAGRRTRSRQSPLDLHDGLRLRLCEPIRRPGGGLYADRYEVHVEASLAAENRAVTSTA